MESQLTQHPPPPPASGTHLLVVVDHREARIFSAELHGSVPHRVTPYDPFGFARDLHYEGGGATGKRQPELKSFYDAIAKTLSGAKQILLFGHGTGAGSAMEQLEQELNRHHPEVARRVVASITVNEHHITDNQLLAKAREWFTAP